MSKLFNVGLSALLVLSMVIHRILFAKPKAFPMCSPSEISRDKLINANYKNRLF